MSVCEIIMQLSLSSLGDKTNGMIDAINKYTSNKDKSI